MKTVRTLHCCIIPPFNMNLSNMICIKLNHITFTIRNTKNCLNDHLECLAFDTTRGCIRASYGSDLTSRKIGLGQLSKLNFFQCVCLYVQVSLILYWFPAVYIHTYHRSQSTFLLYSGFPQTFFICLPNWCVCAVFLFTVCLSFLWLLAHDCEPYILNTTFMKE